MNNHRRTGPQDHYARNGRLHRDCVRRPRMGRRLLLARAPREGTHVRRDDEPGPDIAQAGRCVPLSG